MSQIFHVEQDALKFQFPSNGKAYSKHYDEWLGTIDAKNVSIPFKRESVFKGADPNAVNERNKFQFPSNGKAYSKFFPWHVRIEKIRRCFNSLQTGKRIQRAGLRGTKPSLISSFNSLQTGKRIQRYDDSGDDEYYRKRFQFPSNGKAYSKLGTVAPGTSANEFVSIPFKRESVFKEKKG